MFIKLIYHDLPMVFSCFLQVFGTLLLPLAPVSPGASPLVPPGVLAELAQRPKAPQMAPTPQVAPPLKTVTAQVQAPHVVDPQNNRLIHQPNKWDI